MPIVLPTFLLRRLRQERHRDATYVQRCRTNACLEYPVYYLLGRLRRARCRDATNFSSWRYRQGSRLVSPFIARLSVDNHYQIKDHGRLGMLCGLVFS